MLNRLIIFLGIVYCSFTAQAQAYRFKHITSEEGLSTNFVSSIIQDDKGFMWFGTQDGLCKYDGYQITVFKTEPGKANSLSSSDIASIYQHSDKKIYVGTRSEGLSIYSPFYNTFERIPVKGPAEKTLTDSKVNCFLDAGYENIWIGTSNGLNLFNTITKTNRKYFFPMEKPVEVNSVFMLSNTLYIGTTDEGVWTIEGDKLVKIKFNNPLNLPLDDKSINTIKCIKEYAGQLYFATAGNGFLRVDPKTLEVDKQYKLSKDYAKKNFIEDFEILDNHIYAASKDGFIVYDLILGSTKFVAKDERDNNSLNDDFLTTIYVDNQKNIWLGTFTGGVNISFSQALKFPNLPPEISQQFAGNFSIHETVDKNLWVGGNQVIKVFNRATNKIEDLGKLIENNYVLSMTSDKNLNVWLGTYGSGLIKYNYNTKAIKSFFNEDLGGTIVALSIDKKNVVWAGSYGDGLFLIGPDGEPKRYTTEQGISSDNVIAVLHDSKDNIWLGTDGGGVCFIKSGNINDSKNIKVYKYIDSANSICSNTIYSMLEDNDKNIWFATNAGFCKLDVNTQKFSNYSEKDGLANNFVFSLLADSLNNLWMSTNKGVSKFNPNVPNINGSAFRNYDQKDGLLNIEYTQGAYAKLSSGELAFGSVNGINIFNPNKVKDNFFAPPVYLVSYKRSGKDVVTDTLITYKKYLKLSWRENYFQFELAALDYNAPYKNKYMYKLEGYDNDWSSPTNIRYVSYTELPGGDYVFKVKAANNDGVWNETPYYIYITVVPPFWKTTWFYILVSVFGLAGIIVFTQLRTRAIKKENKILESKVAERTKELEEKNRDITSSIEYANRIQEAILPSRNEIFSKFNDAFILYRPKDIVSGDFYWYGYKNNCKIFAVVDCTGHGVPGAFMSMIGHNILNQVVMEKAITDPGQILNKLHSGVQDALKQGHNEIDTNDGMDVSIITVNETTGEILWAGAFRPAIIVRTNSELEKLSGNRYSVGGAQLDTERVFLSHPLKMNAGDVIYLFSDGYADQFGGDNGKKFMLKRFQDDLCAIHKLSMAEQMAALENAFEQWKGNHEQVDDVLVVGIRF